MRKKLYDEFVAECESSCMDMYIAWLEERVFALEAKVEKFTSYNSEKPPCVACGDELNVVSLECRGFGFCPHCGRQLRASA